MDNYEDIIWFFIILLGCVVFIRLYVARKFEEIAFQKGYDESRHSCAMCFWLGLVGYLYVIALPDLNKIVCIEPTKEAAAERRTSVYDKE